MAVPVRAELLAQLDELKARSGRCLRRRAELGRERLALTLCRWPEAAGLFGAKRQRLDDLGERLPRGLAARAGHARADMNLVSGRLRREMLDQRIVRARERLGAVAQMAALVHPDRPLSRGYARVTAADGRTLTNAVEATAAAQVRLRFADGVVAAQVDGASEAPMRVERKPRRPYLPAGPTLFDE